MTRDPLLLEAGAAYVETLMFKAGNRPRTESNGVTMPTELFVCLCPHLEFQCIEGVFGRAAERPLGDHLHGVEQLVAVSPQRTSNL